MNEIGMAAYISSLGYPSFPCPTGDSRNTQRANVYGKIVLVGNTDMIRHSPECETSQNVSLRFNYYFQDYYYQSGNTSDRAVFIAAAMVIPDKEGDKVIENGYDLGRDAFVARVTLNNTNGPIADARNDLNNRIRSGFTPVAYRTKVVYNDTDLLANVSTQNFAYNVGTDRRVPILVVNKFNASSNETLASFPLPKRSTSHHGGQAGLVSSLPTTPLVLLAALLPLLLL